MLSGVNGSPRSNDLAIRSGDRTILHQQNLTLRAENAFLHQQLADQNDLITELENRLKQYENPHTPSSKQGGAGNQQKVDVAAGEGADEWFGNDSVSERDDVWWRFG